MVWLWRTQPAKLFMVWAEWRAALKYRLWVTVTMHWPTFPTEMSASKIIIQLLPIHGGKCIYTHHQATMKISIKNIPYYTFCMEAAKTKRDGPGKAKRT